ncbi:hypothetical protein N24_1162 [Corynebacterium suranareeae]|uniref:Uncharacterized protein n=1 Tax=Corynebacterium suranareeae TaxID=2506452 RepID=A0A160PPN7_9CORY|nr:hypothetical protein [Corynebacterium suranareeae]BAU95424.1 hypothetical protein N24_1162 [Corynebacterium suranareeae]
MNAENHHNIDAGKVSLAQAFTVEHHEIDAGIEQFLADTDPDPVNSANHYLV